MKGSQTYTYPTASELAQKLAARRAGKGDEAQAAVPAAAQAGEVEPVQEAGETAVTEAPPPSAELLAAHARYMAGENAREIATSLGTSWPKMLHQFRAAGLTRRDGQPLKKLEFKPESVPDDMMDAAGLAAYLGVSVQHAGKLISTLPGAQKVKGKWLVSEAIARQEHPATLDAYFDVRGLAAHLGVTEKKAREIIVTLPSARKIAGRWVVLKTCPSLSPAETAVPDAEPVVATAPVLPLAGWLDVAGLAQALGVSEKHASKVIGALPGAQKVMGKWLVPEDSVGQGNKPAATQPPLVMDDAAVRDLHGHYMAGARLTAVAEEAGLDSWQALVAEFRRLNLPKRDGEPWAEVGSVAEPTAVWKRNRLKSNETDVADAPQRLPEWDELLTGLQAAIERRGARLAGRVTVKLYIDFG
jgi:hypothetical protein